MQESNKERLFSSSFFLRGRCLFQGRKESENQALREDPVGTDLQRIQIVKGSVYPEGVTHGHVYEVAGNPGDGAGVEVDVTEGTCDPVRAGFNELCEVLVTELPGGEKLLRTAGGLIGAAGMYLFTKAAP